MDTFPQRFFRVRVIVIATTAIAAMMKITATTDPPMIDLAAVGEDAEEYKNDTGILCSI